MAKKGRKEKEEAGELENLNTDINALLQQYKILSKKDKNKVIKDLDKESKQLAREFTKTGHLSTNWKIRNNDNLIKKIQYQTDRIEIDYGIKKFNIKASYLARIKDKEKYLDNLYNRSVKKILSETPAPKNKHEAKALESIITQYSKKLEDRDFRSEDVIENSINKLTNFRNKLTDYEYSNYIDFLRFKRDNKHDKKFKNKSDEEVKKIWEKSTYKQRFSKYKSKNKNRLKDLSDTEIKKRFENDNYVLLKNYKATVQPRLQNEHLLGITMNFF